MSSFHRLREHNKLPPTLIIFFCGDSTLEVGDACGLEVAWVIEQGKQDEVMVEADTLDCLMCDCCQEYQPRHEELSRSGDELLCDGCSGGES